VLFVEYRRMVEQLTPNAADEALRGSVLPWASEGRSLGFDFKALDRVRDGE